MESENSMDYGVDYFGNYTLAEATLQKLKDFDNLLDRDLHPADTAWTVIKPKKVKKDYTKDEELPIPVEIPENTEDHGIESVHAVSTQFYFSQAERTHDIQKTREQVDLRSSDVAESLYESLENTNETSALLHLTNLSDTEIDDVVRSLSDKLSLKGTYNLCHSICTMDTDVSMMYIRIICRHLLLQKIIDLEEPSRLMSTVIHELVEVFPEDIQEFLYVPLLNADLKDTTIISTMINSFDPQRRNDSIVNFLTAVQQLKEWHLIILSQLINSKLPDDSSKDKLLNLLLEKASTYSYDKNYGKFILSFLKLNSPFTEEQKNSINQIVAVNETIFKKVMENLIKNMYLYSSLWHIS